MVRHGWMVREGRCYRSIAMAPCWNCSELPRGSVEWVKRLQNVVHEEIAVDELVIPCIPPSWSGGVALRTHALPMKVLENDFEELE